MKKERLLLLAVTSVIICLSACGKSRQEIGKQDLTVPDRLINKEEVRIAIPTAKFEGGFDPCSGWGTFGGDPIFQSTLTRVDANNNLGYDIATEYKVSEDKKIWEFTIRDDVMCHDGQKLTAKDVAFTYNKAKELGLAMDFSFLVKAEATDETHVQFELNTPNSSFLYYTSVLGIVPEHAYGKGYAENPIGSGPYKFIFEDNGSQLIMEKNEQYYKPFDGFKRVVLLSMKKDQAYAAVQAGEVDVANVENNLAKENIPGYRLERLASFDFRNISMPQVKPRTLADGRKVGNEITSELTIRKAIAVGISREEIVKNALYGYGEVAFDMFDRLPWGIKKEFKDFKDGNVEKAIKILEDDGWMLNGDVREKDGKKAEFTLMYPTGSLHQLIANAFAEEVKKLGIRVTPEGLSWTDIAPRIRKDPCVFEGGFYNPDRIQGAYQSKYAFSNSWDNVSAYQNPVVDKHIEAALTEKDPDKSIEEWKKALWDGKTGGSILGDCGYITICYLEHLYFVRDGVDIGNQRVHPHDHGIPITANIDEWTYKK